MIAIGKLRHRVVLEAPVDVEDGAGGLTRTWQPVATLWARIEPLRADERFVSDRIAAEVTHRVTIRHRPDLRHEMRFSIGTRRFELRGVVDVAERHRFQQCQCREIAP